MTGHRDPPPLPSPEPDELDRIIDDLEATEGVSEHAAALERAERRREDLFRGMASLRQRRGLSQSKVAAMMTTSQPAIARLEAGLADPKLSTFERYGAAIGYDPHIHWQPSRAETRAESYRVHDLGVVSRPPVRRPNQGEIAVTKPRAEQIVQEVLDPGGLSLGGPPQEALFEGWLRHQHGDLKAARALYLQVLRSGDPDATAQAMRNLGLVLEKEHDFDNALDLYHRAARSGHRDVAPAAGMNEGWLLTHLCRDAQAIEAYERVIASEHPDHAPNAQINLALLLERQGELRRAVDLLEHVMRHGKPDQATRATRHMALLRRKHGDVAEAVRLLEQVIRSGHPRLAAKAEADLRHIRRKLGRPEDAAYQTPPETPLERAISEQSEAALVREELSAANVAALADTAGAHPREGRRAEPDLLSFTVEHEGHRELAIPVFTRDALIVPALVRNPDWGSWPVVTLRGDQLLSHLKPDESVVINPWTPLESWVTAGRKTPGR